MTLAWQTKFSSDMRNLGLEVGGTKLRPLHLSILGKRLTKPGNATRPAVPFAYFKTLGVFHANVWAPSLRAGLASNIKQDQPPAPDPAVPQAHGAGVRSSL